MQEKHFFEVYNKIIRMKFENTINRVIHWNLIFEPQQFLYEASEETLLLEGKAVLETFKKHKKEFSQDIIISENNKEKLSIEVYKRICELNENIYIYNAITTMYWMVLCANTGFHFDESLFQSYKDYLLKIKKQKELDNIILKHIDFVTKFKYKNQKLSGQDITVLFQNFDEIKSLIKKTPLSKERQNEIISIVKTMSSTLEGVTEFIYAPNEKHHYLCNCFLDKTRIASSIFDKNDVKIKVYDALNYLDNKHNKALVSKKYPYTIGTDIFKDFKNVVLKKKLPNFNNLHVTKKEFVQVEIACYDAILNYLRHQIKGTWKDLFIFGAKFTKIDRIILHYLDSLTRKIFEYNNIYNETSEKLISTKNGYIEGTAMLEKITSYYECRVFMRLIQYLVMIQQIRLKKEVSYQELMEIKFYVRLSLPKKDRDILDNIQIDSSGNVVESSFNRIKM